jgi:uncharacterized membrane protein YkoI
MMKSMLRPFALAGLLAAATCTIAPPLLHAKDKEEAKEEKEEKNEKKVVGSIRPTGDVKAADLPALAKISFDATLQAALTAVPGSVVKAELEVEDGNLQYSFEIINAKKKKVEVEIDAGNGKVLDVDED